MGYRQYIFRSPYGVFYFRLALPSSLRTQYPNLPKEIRKSLRTKDQDKALQLAQQYQTQLITLLKKATSIMEITKAIKLFETEALKPEVIDTLSPQQIDELKQTINKMWHQHDWLDERGLLSKINGHDFMEMDSLYNQYKPIYSEAATEVRQNQRQADVTAAMQFLQGNATAPIANAQSTSSVNTTGSQHLFSAVIKNFKQENIKAGNWGEKAKGEYEKTFNLFIAVVGDKPLNTLTHSDTRQFKEALQNLPTNYKKKPEYRNKTLTDILSQPNQDTLSDTTINKHLQKIGSFFNYAKRHGYMESNLAEGMQIKQRKVREQDKRDVFTQAELTAIFTSKIYQSPPQIKFAYKHWLPLLALFTGARLNELCQLYTSDVYEVDEVWVIDINDNTDDKKIKTADSVRLIPVHNKLIELGFIQFVNNRKKRKLERLFPALPYSEAEGYSRTPSKWFTNFKASIGIPKDRKKAFHSFRHTFTNTLKQLGIEEAVTAALIGHKHEGITYGRYGKGYDIKILNGAIQQLEYAQVDLTAIKPLVK